VRGLRVTDSETLDIVVAVLARLINKDLVASINALGGHAVGISGADAGLLCCRLRDPELGYVGDIESVNADFLNDLVASGLIPIIAPVGVLIEGGRLGKQLVNINADTAAGEIAAAIGAHALVFLTDVPGILDGSKQRIEHLSHERAAALKAEGVIDGGMIPKVDACLRANAAGVPAGIIDGREPHNLLAVTRGEGIGTLVGANR
jgi:acetylglutamate kinase